MSSGAYTAFLGMRVRQNQMDAISNNIANANSSGFKSEHAVFFSIEARRAEGEDAPPSSLRPVGVGSDGTTNFAAGSIRQTNRNLDVAIEGDGFLVVQSPRGERYTRAGALTLDGAGQLVTANGDLVAGEGGPLTIPKGEVKIDRDGTVSVNGTRVDKLRLVRFQDPRAALVKEGGSLFAPTGKEPAEPVANATVHQGALEGSNVNPVLEMVAMLQTGREFELLQRSITITMNDVGRKVSNELGRI